MSRAEIEAFMHQVRERDPHQAEFHQAVQEWIECVWDLARHDPRYCEAEVLERLLEPERTILFRVVWEDDHGGVHVNRGYRVQYSSALGPFKGGLRFHPSVNLSVLKFLGFEQIFKNALTGLPLGGGKGGADFDPKGRSDREVMRFCHALMAELFRYIGPDTDVPAGDIGVGAREIGFLYGQYRRLANEWGGALTGKPVAHGGSLIRPEATGYGVVYFTREMLAHAGRSLEGLSCAVSGAGNVALYCAEKLLAEGARVLTLSDSDGFVHDPDGIDEDKLAWVMELKHVRRGRIREYAERYRRASYHAGERPWSVPCDWAFPCATENEVTVCDALALLDNGCQGLTEGANMPSELGAVHAFHEAGKLFGPAKAANAGGVGVSGLEMSQNSLWTSWSREEVDRRLQEIMASIHARCLAEGDGEPVDYVRGANVAGFRRVADAMVAYGIV